MATPASPAVSDSRRAAFPVQTLIAAKNVASVQERQALQVFAEPIA